MRLTASTSMRMTWPFFDTSSSCWPARTIRAVMSSPFLSLTLMVRTPLVGLPLLGYSVSAVRLP